ncbi:transglutaminase domain-containing protein [bacterium]|nr:transglutaminase domain-containing protein [bacterium]
MKKAIAAAGLVAAIVCRAENYLIQGGQGSRIDYTMEQDIVPFRGCIQMSASFVIPKDFESPSYIQDVQNFDIRFSVPPTKQRRNFDARGNEILSVDWINPAQPIRVRISIQSQNRTLLDPLETRAVFPLAGIPAEAQAYLRPTRLVPSSDPQIIKKARQLTASSDTEFDAVQKILIWLIDLIQYVQRPSQYDAFFSIRTGKGNCQNFSHLSAAMMRAVGIPVRIVNGVTLKQPYDVAINGGTLTLRMAQGRHSWIEVFFPDLGWVPFDPQQTQLFVSNRYIRIEVGLDNEETVNDGGIRWKRMPGFKGQPEFRETIASDFLQDQIRLTAEKQDYGPRKLMLSPVVSSDFAEVVYEASEAAPLVVLPSGVAAAAGAPDTLGNLDFPEGVDFLDTRELVDDPDSDEAVLRKNFLVETAEYVTTQGCQYAQTFILDDPLKINQVGLALHKFGGNGQIWVELMNDAGGKPGGVIASSDMLSVDAMKFKPGYSWIDFSFAGGSARLQPGRYWIALAYTGSPVINWFFTYGKPTGPVDGTRFISMFDETWSHSLAYEFNYRIIGEN